MEETIRQIVIWALPVLVAVVFHEVAHGWVAYRLGDPTAAQLGRLTLNPLAHVDLFGTILVPLMLIVAHSPFVFGYAKPVPVNFHNLRNPKRDMIWVAAAGPAMNLAAGVCLHGDLAVACADARRTAGPSIGSGGWQFLHGDCVDGSERDFDQRRAWRCSICCRYRRWMAGGFWSACCQRASGEIGAHRAFRLHHSDRVADDPNFGLRSSIHRRNFC